MGRCHEDKKIKALLKVRNIQTVDIDNLTKTMINGISLENTMKYFQE